MEKQASDSAIYRDDLKNREDGKEAAQIFAPGASGIVREQDVSEGRKFAAKPTPLETDSSGRFGINNAFYDHLEEGWYTALNHPVALLRAENAIRTPWIIEEIASRFFHKISVLDIGCGAGLLTNALAQAGHAVSGIDLSPKSLEIAKKRDATSKVHYAVAHAYSLPFANESFDAVCAMDVLEHVEEPHLLIAEAGRVLKDKGIFFFHTFNRNPLSYLVIIKGVEWCVRNTPKNMHVYPLFIKPNELKRICQHYALSVQTMVGLRPTINASFLRLILTRTVPDDFSFRFSKSLATGYCGIAQKV